MIEVRNLRVAFSGSILAVKGVSFTLAEGESLGIVGESGSGKTTLMHALTRLSGATSIQGEATFFKKNLFSKENKFLGTEIGMIFQDPFGALNPLMRIGRQIEEGMLYHKLYTRAFAKQRALELLALVGLSDPAFCYNQYPHELSGGMRQRVAIAIAIACNPKLLIADEPTTALDATIQAQILALIRQIQTRLNMGLILITHDLGVVWETCERVLIMKEGVVVEEGQTRELFASPKHGYTKTLLNAWKHRKYSPNLPFATALFPTPATPSTEVLLEMHNLSKDYVTEEKTVHAVKSVSLTVRKGEILGLVGESGSGKSTLGKMLLRLVDPTEGRVVFQGKDITNQKDKTLCQKIQMIFQDPYGSLNPRMTVEAILKEPARIHGLPSRAEELLDLVGLPKSSKQRYPHEFSGGQRQRISIARALALSPAFIVCDEPVSSLDILIQTQIINLLLHLQKELGLSLLFISHDLATVLAIAGRVAVMQGGQIVEVQDAQALQTRPQHSYTQQLLSSIPGGFEGTLSSVLLK